MKRNIVAANPGTDGWTKRKTSRNLAILELVQTRTLAEVAAVFGITRERVRQIVAAEKRRAANGALSTGDVDQ